MSEQDKREQPDFAVQNPRYNGATPEQVAIALLRAKSDAPKDADGKQTSKN